MTIHLWIDIKPLSQSKELDWTIASAKAIKRKGLSLSNGLWSVHMWTES
jgi:hypothetical protein